MSTPIIAAVRHLSQLHESLLHTAQELAHRASIYGVVRVSLRYLAMKCHCCKQTIINHIKKLIELGVIRKRGPLRIKNTFCEINLYTFTISWQGKPGTKGAQMGNSQNFGPSLPTQGEREKKFGRIADEIRAIERSLHNFCTPGSDAYTASLEKIAELKRYLRPNPDACEEIP